MFLLSRALGHLALERAVRRDELLGALHHAAFDVFVEAQQLGFVLAALRNVGERPDGAGDRPVAIAHQPGPRLHPARLALPRHAPHLIPPVIVWPRDRREKTLGDDLAVVGKDEVEEGPSERVSDGEPGELGPGAVQVRPAALAVGLEDHFLQMVHEPDQLPRRKCRSGHTLRHLILRSENRHTGATG